MKNAQCTTLKILLALLIPICASSAEAGTKKAPPTPPAASTPATKADGSGGADGYTATSSTHIDFSEISIDGKMKAPDGFFLQGRSSNSLSQMVKLRSNFRSELRNSRSAIKTIVK